MTPEAHALAGIVRKSIQETEDAFVSYIEASVTLNYSGSDLDRMESEQEHSDAAEAFGLHVIRLYRDVALLAEALGLFKLCDQVIQACPKSENAYELTSEDEGYSNYSKCILENLCCFSGANFYLRSLQLNDQMVKLLSTRRRNRPGKH